MNNWIASIAMLCPAIDRERAAQTAAVMSGNPADASPDFFSCPVGLIVGGPPTHYLAHSRVRDVVLQVLPSLQEDFMGAEWIITQHDDDPPGFQRQHVDDWLASKGLKRLNIEDTLSLNINININLGL